MLFKKQTTMKPDLYPWAKDYVKAMRDGFWTVDRFAFDADIIDFSSKLKPEERELLIRALGMIAQIEVQVKVFWSKLGTILQHPSIHSLGITMAHVEDIHEEAYRRLTELLGQADVFEQMLDIPVIKNRIDYLSKYNQKVYSDAKKQFIYSLILFTLFTENVSLFSQFYVVMFLNREDGVMKDTAQQVKYTRNEELLHAQAGMKIIRTLKQEYPELFDEEMEQRIYNECEVARKAEFDLIDWILNGYSRPGLNAEVLKNFIKERLNDSLIDIGYEPQFDIDAELSVQSAWMEQGAYAPVKFDFFHGENTEYLMEDMARTDNFNLDAALAVIDSL